MEAAAHGDSTLGIPKSVGKEFIEADHRGKRYSKAKPTAESKRNQTHLNKRLGVLPRKHASR